MDRISVKLIVLFDDPFWSGIIERVEGTSLTVSKTTFGTEPKDYEVFEFIKNNYFSLSFSPPVEAKVLEKHLNPKRLHRLAAKQTDTQGIGTKSMQALQKQREQIKTQKRLRSKEGKEREKARLFQLKQEKRKQKHRGR
ncbi:putative protein YjdF [Clostridiales bacterium]|nr:putative protein YjdF [Clostridiales bacterium]